MKVRATAAGRRSLALVAILAAGWLLGGCDGASTEPGASPTAPSSEASPAAEPPPPDEPPPSYRPRLGDRLRILFLGNSHTQRHDVPGTVAALLRAGRPRVDVSVAVAPRLMHLDERSVDTATLRLLRSRRWDVVVFQAQNYSLSGTYDYPNDGSVALVREAVDQGALPILFAEWARRGIDETEIILDAYLAISRQEPACLPPIPETFDHALAEDPSLRLLASDGNHSTAAGAFLAALVLSAAISGQDVARLPHVAVPAVPFALQDRLRGLAADQLDQVPAWRGCPASTG